VCLRNRQIHINKLCLTYCNICHNFSVASAAIIRVSYKNTARPKSRDLSDTLSLYCETKKYSVFVKVRDRSEELGVDWKIILKGTFKDRNDI